jgi:thiol-disulfide isomerase/thioredoxin
MDVTATPDTMHSGTMMDTTSTPEAMGGDMMMSPAWIGVTLTNARTGENFTLKDFAGKVVVVEMMAMWCPTCKRQQGEVKTMLAQIGMPADLVVVALDVDPNEDAVALKTYSETYGFDWTYAIAGADVAREISNLYGSQFINPPSAPMLLIDRKGEVQLLPFGVKSADDLMNAVKPLLEGGM